MTADITVQPLDRKAQRALAGWLGDAQTAGIDVDDIDSVGSTYDDYVDRVLLLPADDRPDPTPTLTMIAMAMGEYLQRNSSLQWRVVEDAQGIDLALSSADDLGVLYPIDPIAQAWEQRRRGWIPVFAHELLKNIGDESD